jgi:Holliday junction resolvase RusA-like endonuclease
MIRFTVYGKAISQGSKQPFAYTNKATGRPVAGMGDDPKELKNWRALVALTAGQYRPPQLLQGAIMLILTFIRSRPKKHFRTGKHSEELRADAPLWAPSTPDLSKLTRAIEDSLKGIIFRDDAQVCMHTTSKRYGERDLVVVQVKELREERQEKSVEGRATLDHRKPEKRGGEFPRPSCTHPISRGEG